MSAARPRLAVLISGTGRNLQAILDAQVRGELPVDPVRVISNRPDVAGLARAQAAGVPTTVVDHRNFAGREDFDAELAAELERCQPDLIALAGFMRILTPEFTRRFRGRLINIHPSLLPRHRGLHTHRKVLESGDAWHGASIHFVTEELDGGPVFMQGRIRVQADDTEASLAQRVMDEVELQLYPAALREVARDRIHFTADGVMLDGAPLARPLHFPDEVESCAAS